MMAKLPIYQSERSVGTGSEFMRPAPVENDIARGLTELGTQTLRAGVIETRINRDRRDTDDDMRLNADALDFRTVLRDRYLSARDSLPENTPAADFTRSLTTFANEEIERRMRERFPY